MSKIVKKIWLITLLFVLTFFTYVYFSTPFFEIKNLANTLNSPFDVVESINKDKIFGRFVTAQKSNSIYASDTNDKRIKIDLKLFNLLTIKSFYANTDETEIFAGGNIVGFSLNGDGVVIIGFGDVETEEGKFDTTEFSDLKKGDIIFDIQGQKINSVADICKVANKQENRGKELDISIKRQNKEYSTKIYSKLDKNSKTYKLGLWVKDDVSGIGTLTFVQKDNNRFGALGHAICDNDTKTIFNINSGEMYNCNVLGVKKGTKGKAGELKGLFIQSKNHKIGDVDKNTESGVYGFVNENYKSKNQLLKAGGKLFAKPGKAIIRTSIDGETTKDYEIEIVKTNYQSSSNEKSMVLRVVDKELLQKTGGIIQGMSGSPIIQNDRIIGAVTHVFINDPTKGFGIYLDWMINQ